MLRVVRRLNNIVIVVNRDFLLLNGFDQDNTVILYIIGLELDKSFTGI